MEMSVLKSRFTYPWVYAYLILSGISRVIFPVSATIFTDDESELTESDLYDITNNINPSNEKSPIIFLYDPGCGACASGS